MEHVGAISEREWTNYGEMHSSSPNEEADFMAQLLGNCSLPNENPSSASFLTSCWPVHGPSMEIASMEVTSMYSSNNSDDNNHNDVTNNMCYYLSQSSSYSGENEIYTRNQQPYFFEGVYNRKEISLMENGDDSMENSDEKKGDDDNKNGILGISLKLGMEHQAPHLPESSSADEKVSDIKDNISKKRPPPHGCKNKRSVKAKKNQSASLSSGNDGDNNNGPILQRQNSTLSICSEDESNASLEVSGSAISNGKTRASRGSATDPQSLYARKRRERINERLRILQNLVPNGTKVDISTMLEEAVQYVKFLQLQIKLLSSDDLWMYSPIAYNGMDMGLDLKIASHNL